MCDGVRTHTHTLRGINLGLIDSPQPPGPCRPNNNSRTTGLFLPSPDLLPMACTHAHARFRCEISVLGDGISAFIHIILWISYGSQGLGPESGPLLCVKTSHSVLDLRDSVCSIALLLTT